MAYFFYVLRSFFIFLCTVFLVITGSRSLAKTSHTDTYYLRKNHSKTWYNNHPIIMDGWKMKILLSVKNNRLGFHFGFYSSGSRSDDYSLSVVCVRQGKRTHTHNVVWSANGGSPVPKNSRLELSSSGLRLLKPDRSSVWKVTFPNFPPVKGMKLSNEGNLVLFVDKGLTTWESFDHPVDTLLYGQRLCSKQWLRNGKSYAVLSGAYFTVYIDTRDGRRLIYGRLPLDLNVVHDPFLLIREEGLRCVLNVGSSQIRKSHHLKFIEFVKLDSYGRLRKYFLNGTKYKTVDMISHQCKKGQDVYDLTQVLTETIYFDSNDRDGAVKSGKTLSECKSVCRRTCSCRAVLFSYDTGNCYMSSRIILVEANQMNKMKSITFVKVLRVIEPPSPPVPFPPTPSPSPPIPYPSPTPIASRSPSPIPSPSPALSPGKHTTRAPPPTRPTHQNKVAAIVSTSVAGGISMIILIILVSLVMLRKNRLEKEDEDDLKQVFGMLLRFSYEDLEFATENFKETLGRGGFGSVFKGVLKDGRKIAVKRLDRMSRDMREFLAEVETIGSIHHFNLVNLVGFCAENSCRLLVYEYMTNGSLDSWIFSREDEKPSLDWKTRKKIILDIAKGLAYLHEDCRKKIIHLDIKPHNILLDENFNAKVSDFGLSKLIERDQSQVMSPVRGTPGYLAPELQRSKMSVKVDVYSFGIVVLEIVSKRRNVDSSRSESSFHLLKILQKKAEQGRLIEIVEDLDEDMQNNREEVMRMIRIGAWCLQNDPNKRPLMSTIVKVLEGVMEVEPNISYKFRHAMVSNTSVENDHITVVPQASVLSAPR